MAHNFYSRTAWRAWLVENCADSIGLLQAIRTGEATPRSFGAFCAPLDEAFTEVTVDVQPPEEQRGRCTTSLEPYGRFTKSGMPSHFPPCSPSAWLQLH